MPVIVVGGNTRNIGKTGVVEGLLRALQSGPWVAIKITQYGHGVCSANGEDCDCVTADHAVAVSEERRADTGTDTSRFLAAGAAHSFWVRTRQGQLNEAMPQVRKLLRDHANCIIESNSVLRFLQPDVYVSVLDSTTEDFKASSKRYLDRADAIVTTCESEGNLAARKARWFRAVPPRYVSGELAEFVGSCLKEKGAP